MALEVTIVSGSGQEHAGCLLLTSEVLFVVSLSEDTQQQAFPITEVSDGRQHIINLLSTLNNSSCDSPLKVSVALWVLNVLLSAGGVSAGARTGRPAYPHSATADSHK